MTSHAGADVHAARAVDQGGTGGGTPLGRRRLRRRQVVDGDGNPVGHRDGGGDERGVGGSDGEAGGGRPARHRRHHQAPADGLVIKLFRFWNFDFCDFIYFIT